jgi:lipopolysaccharide export system protein LptA
VGNTVYYHNMTVMTCDSAVRYNDRLLEFFGNVIINRDDMFIYGQRVLYDAESNIARVFDHIVKMTDRDAVFYTYNLQFDTEENIAHFYGGGTVTQGETLLEADRGWYNADLQEVLCAGRVELRDTTYLIRSDSMGYNIDTGISTFYTKSYIWSDEGDILSAEEGWYDTSTGHYLFRRNSYVITSTREIWAEEMEYTEDTEYVEMRQDIQILDDEEQVMGFGDFGRYSNITGEGMLTQRPSVVSFDTSRGDSLFMRSDTMLLYLVKKGNPFHSSSRGNGTQERSRDDSWEEEPLPEQRIGPMGAFRNEELNETIGGSSEEGITDGSSEEETSEPSGDVREEVVRGRGGPRNVDLVTYRIFPRDTIDVYELETDGLSEEVVESWEEILSNDHEEYLESEQGEPATEAESLPEAEPASETTPAEEPEEERVVVAYRNVKIFRSDFQAVCDSLVGFTVDSMIQMFITPVMWNGDNQITSETATIYTKERQVDRALFEGGTPMMSSKLDAIRYNQISGRRIEALFSDGEMYRVDVRGNGLAYYYMQEDNEVGALQGFLRGQSADITFRLEDRVVVDVVFITNVDYEVFPMDGIPANQSQVMTGFTWESERRPTRNDVFDRTIRSSEREHHEAMQPPQFPITARIDSQRSRLVSTGQWRDRTEDISDRARERIAPILARDRARAEAGSER